jgi:hypothetical protein
MRGATPISSRSASFCPDQREVKSELASGGVAGCAGARVIRFRRECRRRVSGSPAAGLRVRVPFGQFELVAVRVPDPGAQAHPIGPLFERAEERNPLLFQDGA